MSLPGASPRPPARVLALALIAVLAALLAGCGASTKGLIPAAQAGPLQSDFEAVQRAAEEGEGNCSPTEEAISHTEHDYALLPSSVESQLRERLRAGIENLAHRARELCRQPTTHTTSTTSAQSHPHTTPETTTTPPSPTPAEREAEKQRTTREQEAEKEREAGSGAGGTESPTSTGTSEKATTTGGGEKPGGVSEAPSGGAEAGGGAPEAAK